MPDAANTRRWVCFDIGEVLIDETRIWSTWADVLGLPRFTLMATMGAAIAAGGDHQEALEQLAGPSWREREVEVQAAFGGFRQVDLYRDALPALRALADLGYGVAVIGNQPSRREAELSALGFSPDVLTMSDTLGVQKPDPGFFAAVISLLAAAPADIAYVGDRVDNDVVPAAEAGLRAVWVRRGPWGLVHRPPRTPHRQVASLDELVRRVDEVWGERPAQGS